MVVANWLHRFSIGFWLEKKRKEKNLEGFYYWFWWHTQCSCNQRNGVSSNLKGLKKYTKLRIKVIRMWDVQVIIVSIIIRALESRNITEYSIALDICVAWHGKYVSDGVRLDGKQPSWKISVWKRKSMQKISSSSYYYY